MTTLYKYPSINQFRHVTRNVTAKIRYDGKDENDQAIYDYNRVLPVLKFRGTVKNHGTNSAVCYKIKDDSFYYQSRERILSLTSDNAGFCLFAMSKEEVFRHIISKLGKFADDVTTVCLYGEWAGSGIQKNVAVSQLPKMMIIFGIKLVKEDDTHEWLEFSHIDINYDLHNIYSVFLFPVHEVDIDFNYPALSQNDIIEATLAVEKECPVGKYFGVSDIGEGIVYSCISEGYESSDFMFKSKGEKHSSSKVTTLNKVDIEKVANIKEFVDMTVTESRLEQALDNITREQGLPFEMTSLGEFLRWLVNDIMKEEQDTIVANQIDVKMIGKSISNKARPWFIERLNYG